VNAQSEFNQILDNKNKKSPHEVKKKSRERPFNSIVRGGRSTYHSALNKTAVEKNSQYYNRNGKIRLFAVKQAFSEVPDLNELVSVYSEWQNQAEYMILAKPEKHKFIAVKCSKRGNDVYDHRIEVRFSALDGVAEILGNDRIFDINEANPQTNVLFLTLTYDTKLCNRSDAWVEIGKQWNSYVSSLRSKYGEISILRAWEGFKNGYPHIHAIAIFKDTEFDVFEQQQTNSKSTYRIQQKQEFEKYWHSYVDVIAVSSMGGAIRYLTKYLRKTHGKYSEPNVTQALLWIHQKRSFSMSQDFVDSFRLVYKHLHNSSATYDQLDLFGEIIEDKWQFVGIFSQKELESLPIDRGKFGNDWVIRLKNINGLVIT